MRDLLQDLRYALRALVKQPSFSAVVIVILALAIGINVTVFTAVNSVLVRPLPYDRPDRLVEIGTRWRGNTDLSVFSYPDVVDVKAQVRAFADVGTYTWRTFNVAAEGAEPERVSGLLVSAPLFRILGVAPQAGRLFTDADDVAGGPRVALIGDGLWRRRFNADPTMVGRTITLNGLATTIVGIMPPRFAYPEGQQVWAPIQAPADLDRGAHSYPVIARLADGVEPAQAEQELVALMGRLEQQYPESNAGKSAGIQAMHAEERADIGVSLYAMMGAVAFVLLIACANVANLLLVRGSARQRELAVRTALGAGRWRIVRQLLTESVVLALAGAVLGLVLATWGTAAIDTVFPADGPWWFVLDFDWRVFLFTAGLAVLAGLLFGIVPAVQASKGDLSETLKEGSMGAGSSRVRQRLRSALVVAEVALSVVLLAGAGLMVRSFLALQAADPGFERRNLLTASVALAGPAYDSLPARMSLLRDITARAQALPGVSIAGVVTNLPLSGSNSVSAFDIEGRPSRPGEAAEIEMRAGYGDYLPALGVTIMRGRGLTLDETTDTSRHAVVLSETAAARYWPGEDALGRRLRFSGDSAGPWFEVVGVARDVKTFEVTDEGAAQMWMAFAETDRRNVNLLLRTEGDPLAAASGLRDAVAALSPGLPVGLSSMQSVFEQSFWERKLFGQLFATFGLIALVLAAVGLYAVIAYSVSQRTREIGVRIALGAGLHDVLRLVVGGGMRLTGAGIIAGVVGALLATGALRSLLYGVSPRDPFVLGGVAVLLAVVALVATLIPARRAAQIDPMTALRYE